MADGQCSPTGIGQSEDIPADEQNNNSTSAWLSDWWQSAKEKSSSALEFMKRDLTEFSQVIQQDTASAVSSTTAILKEKLRVDEPNSVASRAKQGFNDLVNTVSGALYPTREADDHQLVVIKDSQAVLLDKWQAEVYLIQCDQSTFSHEPEGPPELYEKWLEDFRLADKQQEKTELLLQCPEIRNNHDRLVPSSVSDLEFWQRYFYRVWQLQESRRAHLVQRAQPKQMEECLPWDEDDEPTPVEKMPNSSKSNIDSPIVLPINELPTGSTENRKPQELTSSDEFQAGSTITVQDESVQESEATASVTLLEPEGSSVTPPSCNSSEKGTTSDEWEKDFDLELNGVLKAEIKEGVDKVKDEEDWENWE